MSSIQSSRTHRLRAVVVACLSVVALELGLVTTPRMAQACGPTPIWMELLTDPDGRVPAGTRFLEVYHVDGVPLQDATFVLLAERASGTEEAHPVAVMEESPRVRLDLGDAVIEAGVKYSLGVAQPSGGFGQVEQSFEFIGAAVPALPETLGTLEVAAERRGARSVGDGHRRTVGRGDPSSSMAKSIPGWHGPRKRRGAVDDSM